MRILNLHGFLGAADNKNYKALCGLMNADQIISPKLDYLHIAPEELLRQLAEIAAAPDMLCVGQSLGGYYADLLSRQFSRVCILTNPCYLPHQLNLISDEGMPADFIRQYEALSAHEINPLSVVICGKDDTLIENNLATAKTLSAHVTAVPGGHSSIENLPECLVAALRDAAALSGQTAL